MLSSKQSTYLSSRPFLKLPSTAMATCRPRMRAAGERGERGERERETIVSTHDTECTNDQEEATEREREREREGNTEGMMYRS